MDPSLFQSPASPSSLFAVPSVCISKFTLTHTASAPCTPVQTFHRILECPPLVPGRRETSAPRGSSYQRRSLWKSRRRPPSMQDLLCSPVAPTGPKKKQPRKNNRRQCAISDCAKYALTGGYCIRHGGGKLCTQSGCTTIAQSGGRCKIHGGGSRCKAPACTNVARHRGLCQPHGGIETCKAAGCTKMAHGGGRCISHGGGKRCSFVACTRGAQAGGYCFSHGGGKRCAAPECFRAARKGGRCTGHQLRG